MIEPSRLEGVELFAGLSPGAIRELSSRGRIQRIAADSTLWRAGTEPRGLFVILAGRVRVTGGGTDRPHRVHLEGPGSTIGEVPLFAGGAYPATAVADADVECAVFTPGALRAAIAADPELAFRLLGNLGHRVRTLIERLDALVLLDVRQRLAAHLSRLHAASGEESVRLPGGQARLAEELGTVREVVVRSLRDLEEAGAIRREGRRILVVDSTLLDRLAS